MMNIMSALDRALSGVFVQERFTQDTQPHYIYSPREMTRWVRGIFEALRPLETLPVEGLIRIWAHEALRLFQDRSVQTPFNPPPPMIYSPSRHSRQCRGKLLLKVMRFNIALLPKKVTN